MAITYQPNNFQFSGSIVAVGGAGLDVVTPELLSLHRQIVTQLKLKHQRVVYLGTGMLDDPQAFQAFSRIYGMLGVEAERLIITADDCARELCLGITDRTHAIFIDAGNLAHMLYVWRKSGFDTVLREAIVAGCPAIGLSAGASALFEYAVSKSLFREVSLLEGIGVIKGVLCVHAEEADRLAGFFSSCQERNCEGLGLESSSGVVFKGSRARALFGNRFGKIIIFRNGRMHTIRPLRSYIISILRPFVPRVLRGKLRRIGFLR